MQAPNISHPQLNTLYKRWQEHYQDQPHPPQKQIIQQELAEWRHHLVWLNVKTDLSTAVVTYVGQHITQSTGEDRTKLTTTDLMHDNEGNVLWFQYQRVCETQQPAFFQYIYKTATNHYCYQSKLILPLINTDHSVDALLAGIYFAPLALSSHQTISD